MNLRKQFQLLLVSISAFCLSVSAFAQNKVSGKVLDQNHEPVIGAMVTIKGTNVGTITDNQGEYTLSKVAPSAILEVSCIGYETKTTAADGKSVIDFVINEAMSFLDDVVVIGYGSVKKRDLTGAITSVDADKIMTKNPTNVFDALQGSAAGVQVTSNSGAPGESATIRIRGTATFGSGANPLYVVDNVPMGDISSISPSDIASIEVLKDASSAAIYGSRSANGVILITTKKGEVGKPRVDLNYKHSMGKVAHLIPLTTPAQYRYFNDLRRPLMSKNDNAWNLITDSLRWFANGAGNQFEQIMRISQKDEVNASVAGASEKMNYFLSTGFYNEDGVVINSKYQRITMRMNASYKASERLTIGNNVQLSYTNNHGVDMVNILNNTYTWLPYWNTYNEEGDVTPMVGGKWSSFAKATLQKEESTDFRGMTQLYAELLINSHLKIRSNLSAAMNLNRSFNFIPKSLVNATGHSSGYDATTVNYNWMNEDYITYENEINDHNFSAMVGFSAQEWFIDRNRVYGQDFNNDIIYTLNNATVYPVGENYSNKEQHSMASVFARLTYNWKSRYLFAGNVRYDGSSRFAAANRWGFFPSASAGWRFSDEPFMKWADSFLTDGKLRASYGVTGNEDIANYASWGVYQASGTYNGAGGLAPNLTFANLGWEQTAQYNFGLDLSMLKGRVNMTADYYVKNTSNLLYAVQVPKETGFSSMTMNVGSMVNKGIEFSISAGLIQTKDWSWDVNFNISHNDSRIGELADHAPFYSGTRSIIYVQEGHRVGEFWGVRHDGVFSYDESNAFDDNWNQLTPVFKSEGLFSHYELNGQEYTGTVNKKKQGGVVLKAGDVNWLDSPEDLDGDIDWTADKVNLGCAQPDVFGGLSSVLSWKGLTLNIAFNYFLGGEIYNEARYRRNGYGTSKCAPSPDWIANLWTKPGDVALYPSAKTDRSQNKQACTDYWIEDASFIRLSSLQLSYALPEKLLKKISVKNATVYLYGNNLLTWTNYSGFDPEFGSDSVLSPGIDTGKYPRMREFGLGLNIGF